MLDSNIEWTEAKGFPYGGTYVGHEAVLNNVFMKLGTEWDNWQVAIKEYLHNDKRVIALGTYSGTNKVTGKYFEAEFAHS